VGRKRNQSPVIWTATHERLKKRWRMRFVLIHLSYLLIIGCLGYVILEDGKTREFLTRENRRVEEYRTKETIYSILRNRGVSLSQGLDIADVMIRQSEALDLPLSLILAVMKKESVFSPTALSSRNAMGLMQVHPVTWEEYTGKLNLKVSAHAAFDPSTNIVVATHVIKDLYERYRKTERSESEVWDSVLSAYYAGRTSLAQTGMTASHLRYVADVKRFQGEFNEKFKD
jgi:soluble lytic murein transglycosylase-like protein